MNIAGIQFPVFNPYQKSTVEIYISGCNNKCRGCHNPQLQSFNFGESLDMIKLIKYLKEREDLFSIIGITGGDLLSHDFSIGRKFVGELKEIFSNKEFWLFTGLTLEEIKQTLSPSWPSPLIYVFEYFDRIKTGLYNEDERQIGFPASKNQKLLTKGRDY